MFTMFAKPSASVDYTELQLQLQKIYTAYPEILQKPVVEPKGLDIAQQKELNESMNKFSHLPPAQKLIFQVLEVISMGFLVKKELPSDEVDQLIKKIPTFFLLEKTLQELDLMNEKTFDRSGKRTAKIPILTLAANNDPLAMGIIAGMNVYTSETLSHATPKHYKKEFQAQIGRINQVRKMIVQQMGMISQASKAVLPKPDSEHLPPSLSRHHL